MVRGCRKLLTSDVSVLVLVKATGIQSETVLSNKLMLRTKSKHIQNRRYLLKRRVYQLHFTESKLSSITDL